MACEHKWVKCVNCAFICMDCGAKLGLAEVVKPEKAEPKRRTTKKGAAKA